MLMKVMPMKRGGLVETGPIFEIARGYLVEENLGGNHQYMEMHENLGLSLGKERRASGRGEQEEEEEKGGCFSFLIAKFFPFLYT